MSFKRFVQLSCIVVTLFLLVHLILYQFTKEALAWPERIIKRSAITGRHEPLKHVEVVTIGDLARLSYLYRLGTERVNVDTSDRLGYLNKNNDKSKQYPVVVVGDSFMLCNGDDRRFTDLLKNKLNINCYNMAANGVEDPFTFLLSDFKKEAKILVWEAVERNIKADTFNMEYYDYYFAESKKKMELVDQWNRQQNFNKQLKIVNSSNLKFVINNLSYSLTGEPLIGDADIAKLDNGKELLFYKNDLISFQRLNSSQDLERSVEFITRIDRELKNSGVTLIFFAVPDKYDAYYEGITGEKKLKNDAHFIESLTRELQKNNVIAVNLKDPFRTAIGQGKDLYHFDDTHWNTEGAETAAELVAREIKTRGLLD
ncbi:alginate O-acetyltransferase AlgX-related protein [Pelotomaculum propionicicum]|uniref:AlgX/AlgJ SGNH hydrolase-like domain-containing protein n=1 Tax=Pelotomaculum propionicicum TaxID=258475 RepID=A0A4Y7RKU1_9FIRM|nr:hypothetical protein [Pelotomaculum propionicicum]NLI11031.1 hypothetical protein [Peptococcaceae bacterium]TEB09473.1 hypothetical protein Pmgp_03130 [Pelotomaculum propionicicum]